MIEPRRQFICDICICDKPKKKTEISDKEPVKTSDYERIVDRTIFFLRRIRLFQSALQKEI